MKKCLLTRVILSLMTGHQPFIPLVYAAHTVSNVDINRPTTNNAFPVTHSGLLSLIPPFARALIIVGGELVLSMLMSPRVSAMTLSELIARSVSYYPSIKSSENIHAAAQADVDGAWQQFLPTPSVDVNNDNRKLALQQPMWWFSGGEQPTYQAAQSRAVSAQAGIFESRDELSLRVINAYSSWLNAIERITVAQHDIQYFDGLLTQIERRVNSGASASVERELVVSRRLAAQGVLAASQANQLAAQAQLTQLTGDTLSEDTLLSDKTHAPSLPAQDSLLAASLARSPILQRLHAESNALAADLQVRREILKPQLYLRAEETWRDSAGSEFGVQVGVQWVPGAGLSGLSAVNAAQQRMSAAQQAEESARRQLHENLDSTYTQYQGTLSRLALQINSLQTLITIRDSYLRQFMAGRRQWQEVMNAVRDVSDAKYSIADMHTSLFISGYQLLLLAKGDVGIAEAQPLALTMEGGL